jgi:hypothetical protein
MAMSREQNTGRSRSIKIDNKSFERVCVIVASFTDDAVIPFSSQNY